MCWSEEGGLNFSRYSACCNCKRNVCVPVIGEERICIAVDIVWKF